MSKLKLSRKKLVDIPNTLIRIAVYKKDQNIEGAICFYANTTGNCQMITVAYFDSFWEENYTEEEIKEAFLMVKENIYREQFNLDITAIVYNEYERFFNQLFKKVYCLPYTNNNGSKMYNIIGQL